MAQAGDWYSDTDPKALEVFLELQRKMTPGEKIVAVFQMNEEARRIREKHERRLHPDASDREIFLRVAAHHLDRGTMLRVYGWYPDDAEQGESKVIAEKKFVVHYKSGETETVYALQAVQDDEPDGYVALVDTNGTMKGLLHKPVVDRVEVADLAEE